MTLSIYQYQFTPNGSSTPFVWGAGTPYAVENIDGLGGSSPIRNEDDNRGYIDGSFSGRDFYDARTVTFDILITGDGSHSAQYYYKQLQASLYPQPTGYYQTLMLQLKLLAYLVFSNSNFQPLRASKGCGAEFAS